MTVEPKITVGLGELLWDVLPEGKQLGGAPANFSVMSARLGNRAVIASRLGDDALGRQARKLLGTLSVEADHIQKDIRQPTGTVTVKLTAGQPEYVIHEPVAWDGLEFTSDWKELAEAADAVCFGTLAQRHPVARKTIHAFLSATRRECLRVFDVNLRKPFYTRGVLEDSLDRATIVKLNESEMPEVLRLLRLESAAPAPPHTTPSPDPSAAPDAVPPPDTTALRHSARILMDQFPLDMVCVTLGGFGSLLVSKATFEEHPGVPVEVVDTIGAGDAFTAALVSYYLQGATLPVLSEAGNRWGSWVASQAGAMPPLSEEKREEIEAAIASVSR